MSMVRPVVYAACLALALTAAPSFAFNWSFIDRSVLTMMNQEDLTLLRGALRQALDQEPDGTAVAWSNTTSGASGTFKPLSTTKVGGRTCRRVETFTHARGRNGRGIWEFCKQGSGWTLR